MGYTGRRGYRDPTPCSLLIFTPDKRSNWDLGLYGLGSAENSFKDREISKLPCYELDDDCKWQVEIAMGF